MPSKARRGQRTVTCRCSTSSNPSSLFEPVFANTHCRTWVRKKPMSTANRLHRKMRRCARSRMNGSRPIWRRVTLEAGIDSLSPSADQWASMLIRFVGDPTAWLFACIILIVRERKMSSCEGVRVQRVLERATERRPTLGMSCSFSSIVFSRSLSPTCASACDLVRTWVPGSGVALMPFLRSRWGRNSVIEANNELFSLAIPHPTAIFSMVVISPTKRERHRRLRYSWCQRWSGPDMSKGHTNTHDGISQ